MRRFWSSSPNFYPRPPHGGRLPSRSVKNTASQFLSTPSAWRATYCAPLSVCAQRISIHALRMEGDGLPGSATGKRSHFYPRPPHGGRRFPRQIANLSPTISIHALRMEGDQPAPHRRLQSCHFYPRPPHGGRREGRGCGAGAGYFYPRPPHGGRPVEVCKSFMLTCNISIHALRMEGDTLTSLPSRNVRISIHALRMEGDSSGHFLPALPARFLSTPSAWRATVPVAAVPVAAVPFLSTPSAWRATTASPPRSFWGQFLSTPSAWRATEPQHRHCAGEHYFYPRPPHGGRHRSGITKDKVSIFLSTPSAWRATEQGGRAQNEYAFLSTPSAWRAT